MIIFYISDPPDAGPVILDVPSNRQLLWYEGDEHRVTCEITGGLPLATITWECPSGLGFNVVNDEDSTKRWSVLSAQVNKNMNNKICKCKAAHQAWTGTKQQALMPLIVFCKFFFIFLYWYL